MRKTACLLATVLLFLPASVRAVQPADIPIPAASTVIVTCGDRGGSGALLAGPDGYVLTAGHVVEDEVTLLPAAECSVVFPSPTDWKPETLYDATVVFSVFDERRDRDFALLKLGTRQAGPPRSLPTGFLVSEAARPGDAVRILGYPSSSGHSMQISEGHILSFRRGIIRTDAVISSGFSGGPIIDAAGNLLGVAVRQITGSIKDAQGATTSSFEDYEATDILAIENWMDVSQGDSDLFLRHVDPNLTQGPMPLFRAEDPPCTFVVRTVKNPAVYCLLPGNRRLGFPTRANYFSWYADFSPVMYITESNLAEYQLVANMTFKAGTFIKVTTDPRVYFVVDSIGTVRWVRDETVAKRVAGAGWASLVRDVPDALFWDYREAKAVE